MTESRADKAGEGFSLNDPQKLFNPFPDLKYFREKHPVFCYPPLSSWFVFSYTDVVSLFQDRRLSADRMKVRRLSGIRMPAIAGPLELAGPRYYHYPKRFRSR
jgi:cytochrome P450